MKQFIVLIFTYSLFKQVCVKTGSDYSIPVLNE